MKIAALMVLLSACLMSCKPEQPAEVDVNWLSFEDAIELHKEVPKPIVIAIYVKWCNVCKKMETSSFTNPIVANYINEHFYAVRFDAEQKTPVSYQGKTYEFVNRGSRGTHSLGLEITNRQLSYPTTTFLDEKLDVVQPTSGYQDAAELERLVKFVGTKAYLKMDLETFVADDLQFHLDLTQ